MVNGNLGNRRVKEFKNCKGSGKKYGLRKLATREIGPSYPEVSNLHNYLVNSIGGSGRSGILKYDLSLGLFTFLKSQVTFQPSL